jgi:hypothetical protein
MTNPDMQAHIRLDQLTDRVERMELHLSRVYEALLLYMKMEIKSVWIPAAVDLKAALEAALNHNA